MCILTGGQHSREKEQLRELNTEETVLSPFTVNPCMIVFEIFHAVMREMVYLPKGRGLEHHHSCVGMLINVIGSSGSVPGQMIRLMGAIHRS